MNCPQCKKSDTLYMEDGKITNYLNLNQKGNVYTYTLRIATTHHRRIICNNCGYTKRLPEGAKIRAVMGQTPSAPTPINETTEEATET